MSIHCFLLPDWGHTATSPLKFLSLCLPCHCIILNCERRQTPLPRSCFCQGISSQQEEGTNKWTEINPMIHIGEPFESESLPHLYCVTRQVDGTWDCDPGAVWLQSHGWKKQSSFLWHLCMAQTWGFNEVQDKGLLPLTSQKATHTEDGAVGQLAGDYVSASAP